MASNKIKIAFLVAIVGIAGLTTGYLIYDLTSRVDIRIGYLDGDLHHLAYYVAQEKGFYREAGLNVQAVAFPNGGDVMIAFESLNRPIDIAYLGLAPAIYHRVNNPAATVTVVATVNVNGTALVVRNSPSILTAQDLNGLKIAVPARNNMQDFILSMILDLANLTHANITTYTMAVSDMVLDNFQTLDGFVAWEPYAVKGTTGVSGKYLYQSSDVWANHPCCVIAAHNDVLSSSPDKVEAVLRVHKRATEWILSNPEEAKQIAMKWTNLSHEQATVAISHIGFVYRIQKPTLYAFMEKLVHLNPSIKLDSPFIPPGLNASEFIDWFVNSGIIDAL